MYDRDLELLKASFLESVNEFRVALGQDPLKEFPEEFCMFCGKPSEDVGALVSSEVFPFVRICRDCTVGAQRSFLRGNFTRKSGES